MDTHEINTSNEVSKKKVNQLVKCITDLTAEKRLQNPTDTIFSDTDVRGVKADEAPVIDRADGWK